MGRRQNDGSNDWIGILISVAILGVLCIATAPAYIECKTKGGRVMQSLFSVECIKDEKIIELEFG
ncbi:MAG: hypothetical protein COB09_18760 [Thalassobium sp.]|nr:MAG: hypothetical protein COB09_18760 [Thalassobium sp.]